MDTPSFAPGETQKTITVPLIDDAHVEGNETFQVRLVNPTNVALGSQHAATFTITDNDAVDQPNPILGTPFFVRQQYLDFLSREPEATEPWSAILNNCSDVNNNPACDRLTVSGSFFGSPEFYRVQEKRISHEEAHKAQTGTTSSVLPGAGCTCCVGCACLWLRFFFLKAIGTPPGKF